MGRLNLSRVLVVALLVGALSHEAEAQRQKSARDYISINPPRQEFRIAHDPWIGRDKVVDHFALAFVLTMAVDAATFAKSSDAEMRIFYWGAGAYTVWEIKDGLAPWEKYGWLGGDGFSVKDLLWSLAGVGTSLLIF